MFGRFKLTSHFLDWNVWIQLIQLIPFQTSLWRALGSSSKTFEFVLQRNCNSNRQRAFKRSDWCLVIWDLNSNLEWTLYIIQCIRLLSEFVSTSALIIDWIRWIESIDLFKWMTSSLQFQLITFNWWLSFWSSWIGAFRWHRQLMPIFQQASEDFFLGELLFERNFLNIFLNTFVGDFSWTLSKN